MSRKVKIKYTLSSGVQEGHHFGINAFALHEDKSTIFTASRDATVRRWGLDAFYTERCKPQQVYTGHTDWVNDVVWVPNNDLMFSCSNDSTVKVWQSSTGALHTTLDTHSDYVKKLAFAQEKNTVLSASLDRTILVWDVAAMGGETTGTEPVMRLNGHKESVYSVVVNKEGTLAISGGIENSLRMWDLRSGQKISKLKGHNDMVRAILLDPSGRFCYSGSSDQSLKVWDLGQQRCVSSFDIHDDSIWALSACSKFANIYSGARDGRVIVSDLAAETHRPIIQARSHILNIACVENATKMIIANPESTLPVYAIPAEETDISDTPTGAIKGSSGITQVQILNDRRHVISKNAAGHVQLWDLCAAGLLEDLGDVDFEAAVSERFKPLSIPTWCSLDIKTGVINVIIDELQAFYAEAYATDLDFTRHRDDERVNIGALVLQALFEPFRAMISKIVSVRQGALSGREVPEDVQSLAQDESDTYAPLRAVCIRIAAARRSRATGQDHALVAMSETDEKQRAVNAQARASNAANAHVRAQMLAKQASASAPHNGDTEGNDNEGNREEANAKKPDEAQPNGDTNEAEAMNSEEKKTDTADGEPIGDSPKESPTRTNPSRDLARDGSTTQTEVPLDPNRKSTDEYSIHTGHNHFVIPDDTLVTITAGNIVQYIGPKAQLRDLEVSNRVAEILPKWIEACVFRNQIPFIDAPKIAFYLSCMDEGLPALPKGNKLIANRSLQVRKVLEYVSSKISTDEKRYGPEDITIACNDHDVTADLTLGAIKLHMWRGTSDELTLQYRGKTTA
eukprot:Clim_evm39s253 gene=Clim_evmTU39s253